MTNDLIYPLKLYGHLFDCGGLGEKNQLKDSNYQNELNDRIHFEDQKERE